ncbi:hypothetical protein MKK63_11710 [Methylobacterium sp. J-088]|uniref:hypothetical protein n=1 Tax=Methylobacterium sp. J-088 TaxID=2836664 RepID=UPI001FBAE9FC|nr:hypothetical protein [Methylobacterium sp. J-088]MCJ2063375.1 hypothetical protein [Methylobacterium sp. J-088]
MPDDWTQVDPRLGRLSEPISTLPLIINAPIRRGRHLVRSFQKSNMLLNFVTGPTSSDKTGVIIEEARGRFLKDRKSLVVCPSIDACDEFQIRFSSRFPGLPLEVYHSKRERTDSSSPIRIAVERALLDETPGSGRVVVICHATLLNLPPDLNLHDWHCFIDETLDAFHPTELNLHDSHQSITTHLRTVEDRTPYARLVSDNDTALISIVENRNRDALREIIKGVAERITNPYYKSYTLGENYRKLIERNGKRQRLNCISVLLPNVVEKFGGVTVFSARFEESLHYHLWEQEGVTWRQDVELTNRLRFVHHAGYDKTKIYWGLDRNYSKAFRNGNMDWYNNFIASAEKVIGPRQHIQLENNDIKNTSVLSKSKNGEIIPGRSHGLNKYRDIDHAIIVPAMNYAPVAGRFLAERYGFDRDRQVISFTCHNIYQAISRTSMRDGDMSRERIWVVPSKAHAEWLAQIFEGSSCISLALNQPSAGNIGRPGLFACDKDRKNHSKKIARHKARQIDEFIDRIGVNMVENVAFFHDSDVDDSSLYNQHHFVANYRSSWFSDLYKKDGKVICKKENEYINWLKRESNKSYPKKSDVPLVSPAFYNPLWVGKGKRGKRNIVLASGLMLDFDDSELLPEQLAEIFRDLQMVTYSTHSNSLTNIRYRAYFPTTRPMLIQEYMAIIQVIIQTVEDAGYQRKTKGPAKPNGSGSASENNRFSVGGNLRNHGIDMSKIGPYSLFHLPCRSPSGQSFFNHHSGPGRAPLDVNKWLLSLPPIEEPDPPTVSYNSCVDEVRALSDHQRRELEEAMGEWFLVGTLPGEGNDAMWILYQRLRDLHLPIELMWDQLRLAASSANTPSDRHKQVNHLMNDMVKYRARI